MKVTEGYHCLGKLGKVSDDRFRILGTNLVEPDLRATAFSENGRGVFEPQRKSKVFKKIPINFYFQR